VLNLSLLLVLNLSLARHLIVVLSPAALRYVPMVLFSPGAAEKSAKLELAMHATSLCRSAYRSWCL
jgi:hypothetical protein